MAALHVLDTRYATQLNSLGERIVEPFGDQEHLGVLRTGGFVSATVGNNGAWNPYTELLLDHELDNNMTSPLDDRTSVFCALAYWFGSLAGALQAHLGGIPAFRKPAWCART
ncbi:MAG: hypothetical protein ACKVOF_09545 [Pseudohongiellaceae bacterium]